MKEGICHKNKLCIIGRTSTAGITLVALIVTIVVLLILAAITITYVFGDNSIFKKTSDAKVKTEIGKIEERAQIIYSDKLLENVGSNLNVKVETSQVIEQLKSEGYEIKQRVASVDDITGISLDKETMIIGTNKTAEVKASYEGVEDPFIYYVEVNEKYYQMHNNKGFITIDREISNLTKSDFEAEGGEASTPTLTVTSGKPEIATVKVKENSNNTIEVTSTETEGETVVTVTYGSYTKACTIKVVKLVLATGVTLNETEYVVTGGESWTNDKQLVVTIEPSNVTEKEVIWKSSNPEIATVDNTGLVKAGTKGGEVTITATTKDGSNQSAECKITTELFGKINENKTTYTDSDGNTAQIPDGYAVGTSDNVNKVIGGLVAQDNEGNQFVWIPVGEVKKENATIFSVVLGRYAFVKDQTIPEKPVQTQENCSVKVAISSTYQESDRQTGKLTHAKDLTSFIDNSIIDNGYWFARFEASKDSPTASDAKSKYNNMTWVGFTQPDAALMARKMKSNGMYQSDLVNSYAWDTAIVFIEKSGHTGYASQKSRNTSKLNSGRSRDKVCNIYDMASNCWEWSTEALGDEGKWTSRGGDYRYEYLCANSRSNGHQGLEGGFVTFRSILYRL